MNSALNNETYFSIKELSSNYLIVSAKIRLKGL